MTQTVANGGQLKSPLSEMEEELATISNNLIPKLTDFFKTVVV